MRAAISLCATLGAVGGGVAIAAGNYPSKPIRMVVGFPPGGATDLVARIVQPRMSAALAQQLVIDNRAENTKWSKVIKQSGIKGEEN